MNNKLKELKIGSLCYVYDRNKNKYFYIYLGKIIKDYEPHNQFYSFNSNRIWTFMGDCPYNTSLGELHIV